MQTDFTSLTLVYLRIKTQYIQVRVCEPINVFLKKIALSFEI